MQPLRLFDLSSIKDGELPFTNPLRTSSSVIVSVAGSRTVFTAAIGRTMARTMTDALAVPAWTEEIPAQKIHTRTDAAIAAFEKFMQHGRD